MDATTRHDRITLRRQQRPAPGAGGRVTRNNGLVGVTTWGDPAGMDAALLIAAIKPLLPPAAAGVAALAPFRQPDGSFRPGAQCRCLAATP